MNYSENDFLSEYVGGTLDEIIQFSLNNSYLLPSTRQFQFWESIGWFISQGESLTGFDAVGILRDEFKSES